MAYTHKYVIEPPPPESMNIFDWNNKELQEWVENAIKLQNEHVTDNNNTKFFKYKQTEMDAMELRICMILFGIRNPAANKINLASPPKGAPNSLLKAYTWKERRRVRELQAKISKDSDPNGNVYINYIFVSVAFPHENTFVASENPVFFFHKSRKYMDAGGRVYQNWDDYLRNNHLQQGVMIYPKNGDYTPEKVDDKPEEKVRLIGKETQSCKPSAKVKNVLDKVVIVTGLVLTDTAVVTAVPLETFAATTIQAISTGSYYIGLTSTAYSITTNGYDKLTDDETIETEILLTATTILSDVTIYLNKSWTKTMAEYLQKTDVWENVAHNLTRTQRVVFAGLNIVKVAMSASSVLSALWHLCTRKNRTWFDYYQFCISLFFFANTVTKPITLKEVLESEKAKFVENYIRNVDHLCNKVHRDEVRQELEAAIEEAQVNEQRTCLIRNLQKIQDLDDHFYRVHETGLIVQYTEKGLVIKNQTTLSPETYNQMGKEQLQQKLNYITMYPNEQDRNGLVQKLVQDYNSPDFKEHAQNYVNRNMTDQQKLEFENRMNEMAVRRKDQFFSDTAKFKDTSQYRDSMRNFEADIGNGKNVETWEQGQVQLDADENAEKINQQQYDEKQAEIREGLEKAEHEHELRKIADEYVQNSSLEKEKIVENYMKSQADGQTEEEWRTEQQRFQAASESKKANAQHKPRALEEIEKTYQRDINVARQSEEMVSQVGEEINRLLDKFLVNNTRYIYTTKDNYQRNGQFIWHVINDNIKTSIEEIWDVTDYREATINGKQIFKNMDINTTDETNCIINSCGKNKVEIINTARQLAEDSHCHMKVENARDFVYIITAVQEVSEELSNPTYNDILREVNTMYQSAANVALNNGDMQFTSINSAAVHLYKHRAEWRRSTTPEDYLRNIGKTLIQPTNATGSVFTQDGGGISTNYGMLDSGRYRFGMTLSSRHDDSGRMATMFTVNDAGAGNTP